MKVENLRKLEKLEIKNIYCPVCRRWTRGSLHRCSKTECFNAISFGVLSGKIHLNITTSCRSFVKKYECINVQSLKIQGNCILVPIEIVCKRGAWCGSSRIIDMDRSSSNGFAEKLYILHYDASELSKAGIVDENDESEEVVVSEDVEENKDNEKNLQSKEKSGIFAGLDIKKIAKDFGINFGIDLDPKIRSTILGTVYEYEEGRFRGYDFEKGAVTDFANIKTISLPSVAFPSVSVNVGDTVICNSSEVLFITRVDSEGVFGANPLTLKVEKLLPVVNQIGVRCYTKVISLGKILGFDGGKTEEGKIILWILTLLAKNFFEDGIDEANEKIKSFTKNNEKYLGLLLPFACVAFVALTLNGEDLEKKDIRGTIKKNFGIDIPELNDKENIKKLIGFGTVIGTLFAFTKSMSFDDTLEDEITKKEADGVTVKLYNLIKPYEKTIITLLPISLAIGAILLLNSNKFTNIKDQLEAIFLIFKDKIADESGIDVDGETFSENSLKKYVILAGAATVLFIAYSNYFKKEDIKENENFKKLIMVSAPIVAIVVAFSPRLKDFFSNFMSKNEVEDFVDDKIMNKSNENDKKSSILDMFDDFDEENKDN